MTEVRRSGNYEQWILFFLRAIEECAQDAIETIDKLTTLHDNNLVTITMMGCVAKNTSIVFSYLESNPIIDIGKTAQSLNLSFNTVSAAVKRLVDAGILVQVDNTARNRTFAYQSYLDILRNGT